MAIKRGSNFSGADHGPQDVGSITVNIDSPADEIIQQKNAILAGQRAKTQKERQYANEHLAALENNYRIEQRYRQEAFRLHNKDNKNVANAILKNYKTEVENIQNRARSDRKKSDAIRSILGTAQGFAQKQYVKELKNKKQQRDDALDLAGTDLNYQNNLDLIEAYEKISPTLDKKAQRAWFQDQGVNADWISNYVEFSSSERAKLKDGLKQRIAGNLAAKLPEAARLESIITDPTSLDGNKITMKELEAMALNPQLDPKTREAWLDRGYLELINSYSGKDSSNIYARRAETSFLTKRRLDLNRGLQKKVSTFSRKQEFEIIKSDLLRLTPEIGEEGAWNTVVRNHMKVNVPGRTPKQNAAELVSLVSMGVLHGEITDDQADKFEKATVLSKDQKTKDGKSKEVSFREQFPGANWMLFENNRKLANEELTKKGLALAAQQKDQRKAQIALYDDAAEKAPNNENTVADHKMRLKQAMESGNYDLAKHIFGKYVSGPGSVPSLNEGIVKETIAYYKLYEPWNYNKKYIDGLKNVTDEFKLQLKEELDEQGPVWPSDKETQKFLEKSENNIRKRFESEGDRNLIGSFIGDETVTNAGDDAVNDYRARLIKALPKVREDPLNKNAPMSDIWRLADEIAMSQFEGDWKNGETGKGKYAKSESPGKITYPYYYNSTSDSYNGPSRMLRFKQGYSQIGVSFLSHQNAKLVNDGRLRDIVTRNLDNPRLIWEITQKLPTKTDGTRYTERDVITMLVEGHNKRNPNNPIVMPEIEPIEQELTSAALAIPSVTNGPPDRTVAGIVLQNRRFNGNWMRLDGEGISHLVTIPKNAWPSLPSYSALTLEEV